MPSHKRNNLHHIIAAAFYVVDICESMVLFAQQKVFEKKREREKKTTDFSFVKFYGVEQLK